MTGPGKYDDLVTDVRKRTNAAGVALIVFGGDKGNGFSVQADATLTPTLPAVLRAMADAIEEDTQVPD
jgi:hypothetical protein